MKKTMNLGFFQEKKNIGFLKKMSLVRPRVLHLREL